MNQLIEEWQCQNIGFKTKPPFDGDIETLKDFFLPYIKIGDFESYRLISYYLYDYMCEHLSQKYIDYFSDDVEKEEEQFLNSKNISDDIKKAYLLHEEISKLEDQIFIEWEIKKII